MPSAPRSPRTSGSRLRRRWQIVRANWRDIWRETTEILLWERPGRRVAMQTLWALGVPLVIHDFIVGKSGLFLGFFMLLTVLMAAILFFLAVGSLVHRVAPGDSPPHENPLTETAGVTLAIPLMYFALWSAMRMFWSVSHWIGMENLGAVVLGLFAHAMFLALAPARLRLRHDLLGVFGGLLVASPLLAAMYYFGGADRVVTLMLMTTIVVGVSIQRDAAVRLVLTVLVLVLAALARVSPRALDLIPAGAVRKYGSSALVSALRSAIHGEPRRAARLIDEFGPQIPLHFVRTLQVRAIRGALRARAYSAIGDRSLPLLGLRDRSEPTWLSTLVAAGQLHAEVLGRRAGATRAILVEELESILEDCYITLNRELQGPLPCQSGVPALELLGEWIAAVQAIGAER